MGTIIDMHIHTTRGASDSGLAPEDLMSEARRRGLTAVHISEHDRVWAGDGRRFRYRQELERAVLKARAEERMSRVCAYVRQPDLGRTRIARGEVLSNVVTHPARLP